MGHIPSNGSVALDATKLTYTEAVVLRQNKVLNLIAKDAPVGAILAEISVQVESQEGNVNCGLIAVDGEELLYNSLPVDSTCAGNQEEISSWVQSLLNDEYCWNETTEDSRFQQLHNWGINATDVWSKPIYSSTGRPIGLFIIMYTGCESHCPYPTAFYEACAHMAGVAIERQHSKKRLSSHEQRYKSLYENNIDAIFEFDLNGYFLHVNDSFLRMFGYSLFELRYMSFRSIVVDEHIESATSVFEKTKRGNTTRHEVDVFHKSGKRMTVQVISVPIGTKGSVTGTFGIAKDITDHRYSKELLENQKRILEMTATRASMESILYELTRVVEHHARSSMCNVWLLENDHRTLKHVVGNHRLKAYTDDIGAIEMGPAVEACGTAAFLNKLVIVEDTEQDVLFRDYRIAFGTYGLRACFATPIVAGHGEVVGVVGLYFDRMQAPTKETLELIRTVSYLAGLVMERERYDQNIRFLAQHDALTGLPNRELFMNELQVALQHATQESYPLAILFVDLDQFKSINDSMGHSVGDCLLKDVAYRIQHCLIGSSNILCRIGGDEFTILMPCINDMHDAASVAERILDTLKRPFEVEECSFQVTASIGIAMSTGHDSDSEVLIRNADMAMYEAKRNGKNTFRFYADSI